MDNSHTKLERKEEKSFFDHLPPPVTWQIPLNTHPSRLKEFTVTVKEAFQLAGLGMRMWNYVKQEKNEGRIPTIDPFTRDSKPLACHGVPLGGMGGGSIGRGYRGDFRRWQFIPGLCEDTPVLADQFSVFVVRGKGTANEKRYSTVLYPGRPKELRGKESHWGIGSWDWNLKGNKSVYHALFPRAWTLFSGEPDPLLFLSLRQISPFIPGDYQTSSLPCAVFSFSVENKGADEAEICLLFTLANSMGGESMLQGGHHNSHFKENDGVEGVLLHHRSPRLGCPLTFAIASRSSADVVLSHCPTFSLTGQGPGPSAKEMWEEVKGNMGFKKGREGESAKGPSSLLGTGIAGGVAATVLVPGGTTREVQFSLAWDSPIVRFGGNITSSYFRRYTCLYGQDGHAASRLAHDALMNFREWELAIESWQRPILEDSSLPYWYRSTLFNELYYLVSGGTVWTDGGPRLETLGSSRYNNKDSNNLDDEKLPQYSPEHGVAQPQREGNAEKLEEKLGEKLSSGENGNLESKGEEGVGKFLYLEGLEYVMWNTYDVHFYASFALLALFPKLELAIQRDFAEATLRGHSGRVRFLMAGDDGVVSVPGSVPHDLGNDCPWIKVNSYSIHDTSQWRDLNPKFVLQVYRDIVATGDLKFARDTWPSVWSALQYSFQFDKDGDELIENGGFADQTYDTWPVRGPSAYCGGLWLAALQAGSAHARLAGKDDVAEDLFSRFSQARESYMRKLWNGKYFKYDSSNGKGSDSIQADQLAGQWYTRASGLPSLFPNDEAQKALATVFQFNVMRLKHGKMGAVNGMTPSGKVDTTSMQSREVWTGVTYAVSAAMLHEGLREEAFKCAEGVFLTSWVDKGYWFQTPEGWTTEGHFRSLAYMRPLAIWAIQWCLDKGWIKKEEKIP